MRKVSLADFCCQGRDKIIDQGFSEADLIISREVNRELIFSPLGNQPRFPKLALVGITPGAQSKKFISMMRHTDVETAARRSAFAGAQDTIKRLVIAHGFLDALKIKTPLDLNESDDIFTTSLVKCCLKVNGKYNYAAPDISASKAASYCLSHRFVGDIESYSTIRHVVIFGEPGWEAVNCVCYQGMPIRGSTVA